MYYVHSQREVSEVIAIGCDEAGLELKAKLVEELQRLLPLAASAPKCTHGE